MNCNKFQRDMNDLHLNGMYKLRHGDTAHNFDLSLFPYQSHLRITTGSRRKGKRMVVIAQKVINLINMVTDRWGNES